MIHCPLSPGKAGEEGKETTPGDATMRFLSSCLLALTCLAPLSAAEPPEGFKALFNGKDLTGWKVYGGEAEAWGAEDGLLFTRGGGGGWLMTEEEYGDFELRLEYRVPKMGNSGVAIRSPLEGNPAYTGMEIQILDDPNWEGLRPAQHTGSIYDVVASQGLWLKPTGEWNSMRIVAEGRRVTVEVNGKKVVDANLDEHKARAKEHPGLLRDKGHIGLQSYNHRIDFRDIFLKAR